MSFVVSPFFSLIALQEECSAFRTDTAHPAGPGTSRPVRLRRAPADDVALYSNSASAKPDYIFAGGQLDSWLASHPDNRTWPGPAHQSLVSMWRQPSANGDRLHGGAVRLSSSGMMGHTPFGRPSNWSRTITFSSARVSCQSCCLFIVKGPYLQGDFLLASGGVAGQRAVNMFVKRLIIRVGRGLTAVPAAVKGQKA